MFNMFKFLRRTAGDLRLGSLRPKKERAVSGYAGKVIPVPINSRVFTSLHQRTKTTHVTSSNTTVSVPETPSPEPLNCANFIQDSRPISKTSVDYR